MSCQVLILMSILLADFKEMVQEQVQYRNLLHQMVKRDLLLRYKQTLMGVGWAIFMPLVNTGIFSLIFTRVAQLDYLTVPYPVFAYSGLWVWNFFATALKYAVPSLTGNTNLVTKVYFPREIFPLSAVLVSLVDFFVAAGILVALMLYYRIPVGASIVLLPVILLIHVLFTTAVALLLAMANLFYRDVKYLFEVVIVVWMFTTSVVYPLDRIGGKLGMLMRLNPMTQIVEAYRDVLLYREWPALMPLAGVGMFCIVLLAWAWVAFHRSEFQFAERV
jgi:lipopolysaccharide transport system permease protein